MNMLGRFLVVALLTITDNALQRPYYSKCVRDGSGMRRSCTDLRSLGMRWLALADKQTLAK